MKRYFKTTRMKTSTANYSYRLDTLVASLDSDPEVEDTWTQVADQREAELASGAIADVPGPQAIARLRATL